MPSPHQLILLALLMSAATLATSSSPHTNEKTRLPGKFVTIRNNLVGHQNLQVHCKDRHSDFGIHQVPYNQVTEFYLDRPDSGSDYFCGFVFDNVLHWFDIYLGKRDEYRCYDDGHCYWFVKESGPCFEYPNSNCYPWNQDR